MVSTIRYLITLISIMFLICFMHDPVIAEESIKIPEPEIINEFAEDVTGDMVKEKIELKGIRFSEDTTYYRNIWIDISNIHSDEWRISYDGGYEPTIQFVDLNHDGLNDIFYQSATGGSGGLYQYQLHTLKNGKVTAIPLPTQHYIKGKFINHFNIEIQISPDQEPINIDVADRADEYKRLNIYDENGKLLKQTPVMINPIALFEPTLISRDKGYGLKSYQQISGAYHADQLGTVETLWYFDKDQWVILKTKWVQSR